MCDQKVSGLREIIQHLGEEQTNRFLSLAFRCDRNPDIEHFLHKNAVRFELSKATRTFLLIDNKSGKISAYFTLSFKSIEVSVSKSRLKKLTGGLTNSNKINVFLIAQLGKNTELIGNSVKLNDILKIIMNKFAYAQSLVGGRVVILECENHVKLIDYYIKHGFSLLETTNETDLKTMFIIPDFE